MSFLFFVMHIMQLASAEISMSPPLSPHSCADLFKNGERNDGYYKIIGMNRDETWTVYCDFNSEPGSVWTLVMSWSFANKEMAAIRSKGFQTDAPLNELSPNWYVYRMSKKQMDFLKAKSTHWRSTCSFDTVDIDYIDYLRGNFASFDITTYNGSYQCKEIEYVNVRGVGGYQTAAFYQWGHRNFLHIDSSNTGNCHFNARAGAKPGEDNFGYYYTSNPKFRCTSGPTATTQYWFGSYV